MPTAPAIAASALAGGNLHTSVEEILEEVFIPGTVVYYKGEEAIIKSYNRQKKEFLVAQSGREFSAQKNNLVYAPKTGQKILMRETEKNDLFRRLYRAEVISAEKAIASQGTRKNSISIKVKWLDFNSQESDLVNYITLDKLLPIYSENSIVEKLQFNLVKGTSGLIGKGYFLSYAKSTSEGKFEG